MLLLSIALVVPFYVILLQQQLLGQVSLLGWLIVANGLASSLSAPLVGRLADDNSRNVMAGAALLAAAVGVLTWYVSVFQTDWFSTAGCVIVFFLVTLAHGAVRIGRKVYLVDMANNSNRAQYVAVSNTVIGVTMLLGGVIGVIADMSDLQTVILLLSMVAFAASVYIRRLPDVSG
jgi:MFS family permease